MDDNSVSTISELVNARFGMVSIDTTPRAFSPGRMLIIDKVTGQHYLVSEAIVPMFGQEILVFTCDESGEPTDWTEVVGGREVTFDDAITMLYHRIVNDTTWYPER